ncbi:Cyclic nucleotide-gated olfactory channel [Dinochytrium kinnereticum]|nr:Cyclic nucleotide-gated olfactory channel [Dinochytrium kinnereticum]
MNVAWTCDMATPANILFNYVLDIFFLADTICECFRQQTDEFGFPVTNSGVLANAYLFRRFGILSLFGSVPLDAIPLLIWRQTVCNDHSYLFPNPYEAWAYLRILRLLPAWKAVIIFVNIDVKGLSTPLQRLIKTMAFILGVIHVSACIFWKISMYSRPREGWIWVEGLVLDADGRPLPLVKRYIKSFYSAQMALFFQNRDLRTDLERAYSIIETLLAAMIFGGLLGLIMALIKSTVKTVASKQVIEDGMVEDNIKKFMVSKSFPPRLQDEVMKHIRYKANMMKGMELGKAFGELPDTLTEDIYLCIFYYARRLAIINANILGLYSDLINSISLFKNTDISFRMSVIRALTPLTLPANTTIFSEGEEALDL